MMSPLLSGTVSAQRYGRTVATTHTGSNDEFILTLAPGDYTIYARSENANYPSCSPVSVNVSPGKYVNVSFDCQGR